MFNAIKVGCIFGLMRNNNSFGIFFSALVFVSIAKKLVYVKW